MKQSEIKKLINDDYAHELLSNAVIEGVCCAKVLDYSNVLSNWQKELDNTKSFWVEPTPSDYDDISKALWYALKKIIDSSDATFLKLTIDIGNAYIVDDWSEIAVFLDVMKARLVDQYGDNFKPEPLTHKMKCAIKDGENKDVKVYTVSCDIGAVKIMSPDGMACFFNNGVGDGTYQVTVGGAEWDHFLGHFEVHGDSKAFLHDYDCSNSEPIHEFGNGRWFASCNETGTVNFIHRDF
jgi:hypothetical protein